MLLKSGYLLYLATHLWPKYPFTSREARRGTSRIHWFSLKLDTQQCRTVCFTPWFLPNCHQLNNLITAIFSTSRLLSSNKILFRNSLNEKGKAERLCEVAGQAAAQTPPAELLCLACRPSQGPLGGNLLQICDTAASKRLSSTPCIMEKVLSYPPPPHYTPIILVLANIPWHNIYLGWVHHSWKRIST